MLNSLKIKEKTYVVFFIVNIVTSILALYIVRFELGLVSYIQILNLILSSLFIYKIENVMVSNIYKNTMFFYYGLVVMFGMWIGLGSIHPLFIGYSIMFFQVILITTRRSRRVYVIYLYVAIMFMLGLDDIYMREVNFYPNQVLNIERLLSIFSFFVGNLLILHFDKNENDTAVEEIYKISYIDELTGSKNRHAFFEDISVIEDEYNRYKEDYIVANIDMDGLKAINDNFGHKEGDYAIKELAVNLDQNLRSSDHFYRMGGDEFIIVIRHICASDLQDKFNYIKSMINQRIEKEYTISFSFGMSLRSDNDSIENTMKSADDLMYRMKKSRDKKTCDNIKKAIN